MENTRPPKAVIFGELVGGGGLRGREGKRVDGMENEWVGYFLDDLRAFGNNADQ